MTAGRSSLLRRLGAQGACLGLLVGTTAPAALGATPAPDPSPPAASAAPDPFPALRAPAARTAPVPTLLPHVGVRLPVTPPATTAARERPAPVVRVEPSPRPKPKFKPKTGPRPARHAASPRPVTSAVHPPPRTAVPAIPDVVATITSSGGGRPVSRTLVLALALVVLASGGFLAVASRELAR